MLALLPLVLAGCAAPPAVAPAGAAETPATLPLAFSPPVVLNAGGYGYEPSIEAGPDGTLYATAHKASLTNEGTRLASWLWHSRDHGATWQEMPSPAQAHDKLFAFEGDLAVDAKGRVYYVDTYLADNTISRWSTTPEGPSWDFTRPIHGTTGVDDRPWLAAHGDGVVYYLGNNGAAVAAPDRLLQGRGEAARIWLYRSVDGGETWSLGQGFPGTAWCGIAASPADDVTVFVGCTMNDRSVVAYASGDRGATWTETEVGGCEEACGWNFPSVGADAAGNAYLAWIDGTPGTEGPAGLRVARSLDAGATWETLDATPFEGKLAMVWVSGGREASLAVTFYGTDDLTPGQGTEWRGYALVSRDAAAATPTWTLAPLDAEPVARRGAPPGDFFQNVFGPDGALHVAFQRQVPDAGAQYVVGAADILHVRAPGPDG